nr:hypothetical protein [Tanacetum cinerariifolium]
MDVEIEQDDLNQKILTSLAPEWLMYTIVWRNRDDLDTMSLDDVYNHLKVYEPEVQKKSELNSQNMTFISSSNTSSGKGKVHTPSVPTTSTQVSTASTNVAAASPSHDTCRAPRYQDKGKRESYKQGPREEELTPKALMAIGWDWSYKANDEENHALVADDEVPTEFALMAKSSSSLENKVEARLVELKEQEIKFCEKIRGLKRDVENNIDDKGYWDSGFSRHITGNISYLSEYEPYDGGYVSFGQGGGKITGKGIIKTGKLKFETVYFMKELKANMFSMSQIYDNKNSHLFTDSECIVLGKDFKLKDDTNVLLRTPRQHNMYSNDLNNIVPHKNLTYLVAKASVDESIRKHYKASCKTKLVNFVSKPFHTLHMDLFGLTSVSSLNHKWYCLVVTDDFSRLTWTFFLRTKDETSSILRNFITEIENLKDLKVKIIRCDNRGEFKNKEMNEFYTKKGIRIEFSNARTPQQNGAEAVNTACYVQNRVLVNKFQNKTSYELFNSRIPAIGFLRPFRCHVMILNTLDHLGKFDAKGDEGYFVGYSLSSKAFRVFNKRTKKVEKNLHVDFLVKKLIEKGAGLNWLFDIDTLTNFMNYVPVVVAGKSSTNISAYMEIRNSDAPDGCNAVDPESSGISNHTATSKVPSPEQVKPVVSLTVETQIPTVSLPVSTVCLDISPESSSDPRLILKGHFSQNETPSLDNTLTLSNRFENTFGMEADLSNMETSIPTSLTLTFKIHKDHPKSQIIGPVDTIIQTRYKSKEMEEQSFIATIHQKTNPNLLYFCLFSCFLSQEEPKKIFDALKDPRVRPIGTKWVLKNKKDERGIVIRNKARLVSQGYTQKEGIDYEEVFAPVARIKAIRLFLAYASFMSFIVYKMNVKSAFLYDTINEEVYVMQPLGFQDLEFPNRVYKVVKAMYGLHQAPRAWYDTLSKEFEALTHDKFQISAMGELTFFLGLQVLQKKDGIFLSQDKYVGDILKKFRYSDVRSTNTPIDKENPYGKDGPGEDVELHLYRSMIGSLMYLTTSRPDIMFAVCVFARHQVTPK